MRSLEYYIDLTWVLTIKEIKVKYKNSFLGYLWSILHPLLLATVYYFAFKLVLKLPIKEFTLFILLGLFPWQWFSNSVMTSASTLLSNASLIKKVNFPRWVIPLANVLNDTVHFILSLPILIGLALFYKKNPSITWIYGIPLLVLIQFFLTFGIALIISSINLFFRDLERFVSIGLNVLFYLTPIVYNSQLIPNKYKIYFLLNPLYGLIESWHSLILTNIVDRYLISLSLSESLLIFFIGFFIFRKLSWKFAEIL